MSLKFREATGLDLPFLVDLLADDELGAQREDASKPLNHAYTRALACISADPNNELIVIDAEMQIAGMLQLSFIPYLSHIGTWRCLIEGVRIHSEFRGQGLGTKFIEWSINRARKKGCKIIQLTSDKRRPDAISFYRALGFETTHEGLKLKLD